MPQTNVGIVPGGAIGSQLVSVTRRAFIPRLVVQLYKATPLLSLLMRNAQRAKGGVSQVTVPVQNSSFVSFSWSDYSGTFPQPADVAALQNAEFNLKLGVVPIPFMGMEALIQSSEVVIPLLKARMADAKTVAVQAISSALFTNNQPQPTQVDSLFQAYDDGTNVTSYGGIPRTGTTGQFWRGQYVDVTGAANILTRSALSRYITQASVGSTTGSASAPKYGISNGGGGEAVDFAVMNPGDWTTLLIDFMTVEQFRTSPGSRYGADTLVNAGFRGLMLQDTPIFMDPWCPKGQMYLFNSRYLAFYMSEDAPFAFSGFYSAIPNLQIANIGVVIVAFNVACTKPASGMHIVNISGGAF